MVVENDWLASKEGSPCPSNMAIASKKTKLGHYQDEREEMKFGGWFAASITVPIVVTSVELFITRHFYLGATGWDYAGLALSLFGGIFCVWRLPVSITKRVWLTVAFVPVGVAVLMFYSLFFVCTVFGDC